MRGAPVLWRCRLRAQVCRRSCAARSSAYPCGSTSLLPLRPERPAEPPRPTGPAEPRAPLRQPPCARLAPPSPPPVSASPRPPLHRARPSTSPSSCASPCACDKSTRRAARRRPSTFSASLCTAPECPLPAPSTFPVVAWESPVAPRPRGDHRPLLAPAWSGGLPPARLRRRLPRRQSHRTCMQRLAVPGREEGTVKRRSRTSRRMTRAPYGKEDRYHRCRRHRRLLHKLPPPPRPPRVASAGAPQGSPSPRPRAMACALGQPRHLGCPQRRQ
mmetsp:Transcript_50873/g.102252  ORF Transcript_50873/g.102252 Transcript_50873/m.102252 type:complete len:273 (-) Transcript_50873:137-955(-)